MKKPHVGANFVMSHAVVGMTGMQDPTKRFGEIITGIEDPRKMLHDEIFLFAPFLDGKMLDVNVPSDKLNLRFTAIESG